MKIPVLMYHKIVSNNRLCNKYAMSVEKFKEQMQYLKRGGYITVGAEEMGGPEFVCAKRVMITFDDGFESDFTIAMPILKNYGFKSTHFIATDFIETEDYMSWGQLLSLKDADTSICSHAKSHRPLGRLDDSEIGNELLTSKRIIEQKLGIGVNALSLPKGSKPKRIYSLFKKCGYKHLFTSWPSVYNPVKGGEFREIGRIFVHGNTDFEDFKKAVSCENIYYRKKQASFLAKNLFKRILLANAYSILKEALA